MANPAKPKRRWLQFSLRTLLVFMVLVAIGLSWFASRTQQARRQKEAVEAITKLGGWVAYDYQFGAARKSQPPEPGWPEELLGKDFVRRGVAVGHNHIDSHFTDVSLENLKELHELQWMDLNGTHVTDAGLKHLEGFSRLRWLGLCGTNVTNEGVQELRAALPNCEISH